jgi:photosystem II stability/assembly factor-like uncharacterized protein
MLIVGTASGIYGYELQGGEWNPSPRALDGEHVTAVAATDRGGRLLAAVRHKGLFASRDGGRNWSMDLEGVSAKCLAVGPDGSVYVGADPAAIYCSRAGEAEFREFGAIRGLPSFPTWTFPTPPHIGNIHDLACPANDPDTLYAAVEVGGVIVSRDHGETWTESREGLHLDVHSIACIPGDGADVLYAATGQGFFRSRDGGGSWESACEGLASVYMVPLAVHAMEPQVLFSAATQGRPRYWRERPTGAACTIYRSEDGGSTWRGVMRGLPETLPGAVEVLATDPAEVDTVYAGTIDGTILASPARGDGWQVVATGLAPIEAMVAVS